MCVQISALPMLQLFLFCAGGALGAIAWGTLMVIEVCSYVKVTSKPADPEEKQRLAWWDAGR
eukprot:5784863-Amphidinium_carterae.1